MLFDLRGRGRRRTVRIVYLGMALLFGVGFIGFGVGVGSGGGGILNALTGNEGSSSVGFTSQIKQDRKLVHQQPNNVKAWGSLVRDTVRQAGTAGNYSEAKEGFTSKARPVLNEAQQAWQHYLTLKPSGSESATLANEMIQLLGGSGGLNQPVEAEQAMQIVIAARPPSAALYAQLAEFAYQAKDSSQGDLASKQSLALAPAAQRPRLKEELVAIKANPKGGGAPTTATTTVGGKEYNVKLGPNGTAVGTAVTKTPAPSKTSSPKKTSSAKKK
jgi:hypothetical protein